MGRTHWFFEPPEISGYARHGQTPASFCPPPIVSDSPDDPNATEDTAATSAAIKPTSADQAALTEIYRQKVQGYEKR
jgi:hypothetical protein